MTRTDDRGRAGIMPDGRCYETPIEVQMFRMVHGYPLNDDRKDHPQLRVIHLPIAPPESAQEFLANVERNEGRDNPFGRYWPIVKGALIGAVVFLVIAWPLTWLMNWWLGR